MRSVGLISGGLDSTVALALARRLGPVLQGITVRYGQKAEEREVEAARRVCRALGVPHRTVGAAWLGEIAGCALVRGGPALPRPGPDGLEGNEARESAAAVWVPNRNGVLVNIAAAFAEALGADALVAGFNLEEAATFPDNGLEFVQAATAALARSTRGGVRLECPLAGSTKEEILRLGKEASAPVGYVWPCYEGGPDPCGACESCRRFRRALARSGLESWYNEQRRSAQEERD